MQVKQNTEYITFSLKNDERLIDLGILIVGTTIVKKSDHCNTILWCNH